MPAWRDPWISTKAMDPVDPESETKAYPDNVTILILDSGFVSVISFRGSGSGGEMQRPELSRCDLQQGESEASLTFDTSLSF